MLGRWLAAAVEVSRTPGIIRISVLQALALAASGDQAGALHTLTTALALACPRGYVRVFADEGPAMAALLGQLAAAQVTGQAEAASVPPDFLARVLAAFGPQPTARREAAGPGADARRATPGLAEPLTEREMEVLRLLDAGRSNQGISRDLTVTLDTTKKHVSHILAKLGAASRSEAVARARQLGLFP